MEAQQSSSLALVYFFFSFPLAIVSVPHRIRHSVQFWILISWLTLISIVKRNRKSCLKKSTLASVNPRQEKKEKDKYGPSSRSNTRDTVKLSTGATFKWFHRIAAIDQTSMLTPLRRLVGISRSRGRSWSRGIVEHDPFPRPELLRSARKNQTGRSCDASGLLVVYWLCLGYHLSAVGWPICTNGEIVSRR